MYNVVYRGTVTEPISKIPSGIALGDILKIAGFGYDLGNRPSRFPGKAPFRLPKQSKCMTTMGRAPKKSTLDAAGDNPKASRAPGCGAQKALIPGRGREAWGHRGEGLKASLRSSANPKRGMRSKHIHIWQHTRMHAVHIFGGPMLWSVITKGGGGGVGLRVLSAGAELLHLPHVWAEVEGDEVIRAVHCGPDRPS